MAMVFPSGRSTLSNAIAREDSASPRDFAFASVTWPTILLPRGIVLPFDQDRLAVVFRTTASPVLSFLESTDEARGAGTMMRVAAVILALGAWEALAIVCWARLAWDRQMVLARSSSIAV